MKELYPGQFVNQIDHFKLFKKYNSIHWKQEYRNYKKEILFLNV